MVFIMVIGSQYSAKIAFVTSNYNEISILIIRFTVDIVVIKGKYCRNIDNK